METVTLRGFRKGDEFAVSDVICTTLAISNRRDYSPEFIEENIKSHSPEVIAARAMPSRTAGLRPQAGNGSTARTGSL